MKKNNASVETNASKNVLSEVASLIQNSFSTVSWGARTEIHQSDYWLDEEVKRFIGRTNTIGEFMNQHAMQEASIPNPALEPFGVLIGNWNTTGTHLLIPDTILHGRTTFEWLENGAFLMMRSEIDEPSIPSGIAIIGSDDSTKEYFMLYFDERGVSRKFEVTLRDNVWKWWRNVPGFSQRYQGTIVDGGNTIIGKGELSKDGLSWEKDLDLTYTRVE